MMDIAVSKVANPGSLPPEDQLGFGKYFTDHMFTMDYETDQGWHNPRIVPYGAFAIDPSAMMLHYGQGIFEGMKAFRTRDGRITTFRTKDYLQRFNRSAKLLCIPQMDTEFLTTALYQLLTMEKNWVPGKLGTSLYIRPFVIATDPYVGIKVSNRYKLFIILSPSGAYYASGFKPVSIKVETNHVRAVKGGLGEAKTAANYAASLKAEVEAKKDGFTQVLWLDAVEHRYIEEVGTMNIFFKINGEVITPALNGSILGGITRRTVLELSRAWGIKATERRISVEEVYEAHAKGQLEEVFGSGTAAVISPVGKLSWQGQDITINNNQTGEYAKKLFDQVTGLQCCEIKDEFGWVKEVTRV